MANEPGVRIGSFAGAAIVIEPAFLLLAAYVLGSGVLREGMGALPGLLIYVGILFAAILIHELGHAAMAAALRIPSKRIVLTFFGGYVQFAHQPKKLWHEIAVSSAGPGANLLTWVIVTPLITLLAGALPSTQDTFTVINALQTLAFVSLLLGAFNLLPGFPLDGGHILRAVLTYFMSRPHARMSSALVGLLVAAGLALLALASGLVWTGFIAVLLGLAAWAELSGARRELAAQG